MKLVRLSWFIVVIVIIVSIAVPAMREQRVLFLEYIPGVREIEGMDLLQAQNQTSAKGFVQRTAPDDPQMLLAAGLLSGDDALLRQAAVEGNLPAAWSAYVASIRGRSSRKWTSIAFDGIDPTDSKEIAATQKRLIADGRPDHISPKDAEPVLSMLQAWQQADPKNGYPVACEAICRYGLRQPEQALALWSRAGKLPIVTQHDATKGKVIYELLQAMGMPSALAAINASPSAYSSWTQAREGARMAVYEGRIAQLEGRSEDAIAWWEGTVGIGLHLAENSDTLIDMFVGTALVGMGGAPVWQWVPDKTSGLKDGPLYNGRFFWGKQHDFWVQQVGAGRDAALRDTVVQIRARSQLSHGFIETLLARNDRLLAYPIAAGYMIFLGGSLFMLYLLVGSWRRRQADTATSLTIIWQLLLTLAMLMPLVALVVITFILAEFNVNENGGIELDGLVSFGMFLVPLLILPPLSAIRSRTPGAHFRTAWRGNLRRILPVAIAIFALAFLALDMLSVQATKQFTSEITDPDKGEVAQVKAYLGDKWTDPPIPKDAWRAEYPPEAKQE